jgi:hypothetical protein
MLPKHKRNTCKKNSRTKAHRWRISAAAKQQTREVIGVKNASHHGDLQQAKAKNACRQNHINKPVNSA